MTLAGGKTPSSAVVLATLAALTVAVFLPLAVRVSSPDDLLCENPGVLSGITLGALAFHGSGGRELAPADDALVDAGRRDVRHGAAGLSPDERLLSPLRRRSRVPRAPPLTGATWRSALAAALFAVHPLHVESVAWISERKDVLSGVFFWLALGAYRRYAALPSSGRYVLVTALLAAGLLAKPVLVTLPLLFLVLDGWPLGRLRAAPGSLTRLVREKLPWLALSTVFSAVTLFVQSSGQALQSLETIPFVWRVQNALIAYVRYLGSTVWPVGLSFCHPHPTHAQGTGAPLSALALIVAFTLLAFTLRGRHPALLAGWCWYLGLLVPVIGLVQVGVQTVADRYMYLPLAGVAFTVIWPLADLLRQNRRLRAVAACAAVFAVGALAAAAHAQTASNSLAYHAAAHGAGREYEKKLAHYTDLRPLPSGIARKIFGVDRGATEVGGIAQQLRRHPVEVGPARGCARAVPGGDQAGSG
jgi:hypothetical protein